MFTSRELFTSTGLDLRLAINNYKWGTTPAVVEELVHRDLYPGFIDLPQGFTIPVSGAELESTQDKYPWLRELDRADQTLIVAAIRDEGVVLTDDGGLIMECQAIRVPALRVPDFCIRMVAEREVPKSALSKALKYWGEIHRYSKRDLKRWRLKVLEV
ncbi:MAG: hypothetical protein ACTSU5_15060 [Promethearchaeota archaeon]